MLEEDVLPLNYIFYSKNPDGKTMLILNPYFYIFIPLISAFTAVKWRWVGFNLLDWQEVIEQQKNSNIFSGNSIFVTGKTASSEYFLYNPIIHCNKAYEHHKYIFIYLHYIGVNAVNLWTDISNCMAVFFFLFSLGEASL